ncbi:MAG: hypothetical protein ACE5H3_03815 [Planctomycetota bacterium]
MKSIRRATEEKSSFLLTEARKIVRGKQASIALVELPRWRRVIARVLHFEHRQDTLRGGGFDEDLPARGKVEGHRRDDGPLGYLVVREHAEDLIEPLALAPEQPLLYRVSEGPLALGRQRAEEVPEARFLESRDHR